MSLRVVEIRGEVFVTLESAAECYQVEARWVEEVYEYGLLGAGERVGSALAVRARELDRLAAILRWHRHLGLELEAILPLLG